MGVRGKCFRMLKCLYKSIKTRVKIGQNLSDAFDVKVGVCQGDPISVYLFSFFVNSLITEIENAGLGATFENGFRVPCLAFADDICVTSETPESLQKLIDLCYRWTCDWHMTANAGLRVPPKSAVMIFDKNKFNGDLPAQYHLGPEILPTVNAYEYLGVKFDSRIDPGRKNDINFTVHAESKVKKCNSKNGLVKKLVRDNILPKKLRIMVHESLVHGGILYGSESWSWGSEGKLEAIDAISTRNFHGVYKWGSASACKALHGRPSLIHRRNLNVLVFWFRTVFLPDYRISKNALQACRNRNSLVNRVARLLATIDLLPHLIIQEVHDRLHTDSPFSESEFRERVEPLLFDRDKLRVLTKLARSKTPGVLINAFHEDLHKFVGCSERAKLIVGADSLSVHVNLNVQQHSRTSFCPGCGNLWTDKAHCIFSCPGWTACRNKLRNTAQNNKLNAFFEEGGVENCRKLLSPEEWRIGVNVLIDQFCRDFSQQSKKLLICCSTKGVFQPSLAKCVNLTKADLYSARVLKKSLKFHENMIGEIFEVDFPICDWQTVTPIQYDPFSDRFTVSSVGLDVELTNDGWDFMVTSDVDLNGMFHNSQVIHRQSALKLPPRHQIRAGVVLTENILGVPCEIRINRRYHKAEITGYDENQNVHTITINNISGSYDLHAALSRGELKLGISPHVLAHLRALVQSRRKPRGRCSNAGNRWQHL